MGGLLSVPYEKLVTPESVAERKASSRDLPRHPPAGTLIVDIDGLVWCARLALAEGGIPPLAGGPVRTVHPPNVG